MGGSSLWPSPDTRLIGEPQRRSMIPCQGILQSAGTISVLQESRVRILQRVPVKTLPSGTKLRWLAVTRRVRASCKCENITVWVCDHQPIAQSWCHCLLFSPWKDWMSEKGFWRLTGFVCRLRCTIDGWLHGSVKLVIVLLQLDPIILPRHPPLFSSTCHCASKYNETLPLRTPTLGTKEGNF